VEDVDRTGLSVDHRDAAAVAAAAVEDSLTEVAEERHVQQHHTEKVVHQMEPTTAFHTESLPAWNASEPDSATKVELDYYCESWDDYDYTQKQTQTQHIAYVVVDRCFQFQVPQGIGEGASLPSSWRDS
jgi:hypothetical protein